ncbi:PREDICTED: uncharacterized protein LOC104818098, partial [Tarenaya hassleriana]|uniref:uncharacterized protein LOC104818098 n=1 Tax=Tarenaya hassleriana TaxID=28532 RepID=UPI00053C2B01
MAVENSSSNTSDIPSDTVFPYDSSSIANPLLNINVSNVSKLMTMNYITWSVQIRALLQGYNLDCFLDPANNQPATLSVDNAVTANPKYGPWFRQDRLVFSALLGSVSPSCQALIASAASSGDAWQTLATTYGRSSRGHLKQIKDQLRRFTKGTKSIDEYMHFYKVKADELSLLGKPLDHEDLLDFILVGLGDDFKPVKDVVHAKDSPMSFIELHEKLLNHEADISALQSVTSDFPVTATVAQHKPRSPWRDNSRLPYEPRGSRSSSGRGYLGKCQLCGTQGHSARFCRLLRSQPGTDEVIVGDGSGLAITHSGFTHLLTSSRPLSLHNVKDRTTGAILAQGTLHNGVYEWPTLSSPSLSSVSAFSSVKSTVCAWHSRLGHPSVEILHKVLCRLSLPSSSSSSLSFHCEFCSINKSYKLSFFSSSVMSSRPLEVVFSDVWMSPIESFNGYRYYVVFVDHFTRYTWLYPLKRKSHVSDIFVRFKSLVETRFQSKLMSLYSDNDGEYVALKNYLSVNGISHYTTPPHTPEHNGISERKHRHIVETGLTLLTHSSIPSTYWTLAFSAAVYLINRLPTSVLSFRSPFEAIYNVFPNYSKLRVFGCLCFPWLRPYSSHKLQSRSYPCVFVGYSLSQSAFLCLHVSSSHIFVSRHVTFVESEFPFPRFFSESSGSDSSPLASSHVMSSSSLIPCWPTPPRPAQAPAPVASPTNPTQPLSSTQPSNFPSASPLDIPSQEPSPLPIVNQPSLPSSSSLTNLHPMTTRSKNQIFKPNQKVSLSTSLSSFLETEPTCVSHAMKDPRWRSAMSDEFNALVRNGTWSLVPPNPAYNVVGCSKLGWSLKVFINVPVLTSPRLSVPWLSMPPSESFSASLSPVAGLYVNSTLIMFSFK